MSTVEFVLGTVLIAENAVIALATKFGWLAEKV